MFRSRNTKTPTVDPEDARSEKYLWRSTLYNQKKKKITKVWSLDEDLVEILKRNFVNLPIALEVFTVDKRSFFINLFEASAVQKCLDLLFKHSRKAAFRVVASPVEEFQKAKFFQKWQTGEITNQEFLLLVNKYSGRSFNDLTQYPIFPWILSKYRCSLEDLRKEITQGTCYRNLALHTGILSEEKKANAEKLYQEGP